MTNEEEAAIRSRIPLRLSDAADVSTVLGAVEQLRAEVDAMRRTIEGDARLLASANLQLSEAVAALRIVKAEYAKGTIQVAFGLPVEVANVLRKADGLPALSEGPRNG